MRKKMHNENLLDGCLMATDLKKHRAQYVVVGGSSDPRILCLCAENLLDRGLISELCAHIDSCAALKPEASRQRSMI